MTRSEIKEKIQKLFKFYGLEYLPVQFVHVALNHEYPDEQIIKEDVLDILRDVESFQPHHVKDTTYAQGYRQI